MIKKNEADKKNCQNELRSISLEFKDVHIKEFYSLYFESNSSRLFNITMSFKSIMFSGMILAEILILKS